MATVQEIKGWYQQLAILLNRLEGSGEVLDLVDDEQFGRIVQGQTGCVRERFQDRASWGTGG